MTSPNKIQLHEVPSDGMLRFRTYFIAFIIASLIVITIFYFYTTYLTGIKVSLGMTPFFLVYYLYGFWDTKNREKFFIQVEPEKISFKNSSWNAIHELKASEIHHIEINLIDIQIFTHDLRSFTIDIGAAKHSDIKIIKDLLNSFRDNLSE